MKTLNMLSVGESAVIHKILTEKSMRRRLFDIGMVDGTKVKCIGKSPCNDPSAYLVRGAVIAIRNDDASKVLVQWD